MCVTSARMLNFTFCFFVCVNCVNMTWDTIRKWYDSCKSESTTHRQVSTLTAWDITEFLPNKWEKNSMWWTTVQLVCHCLQVFHTWHQDWVFTQNSARNAACSLAGYFWCHCTQRHLTTESVKNFRFKSECDLFPFCRLVGTKLTMRSFSRFPPQQLIRPCLL